MTDSYIQLAESFYSLEKKNNLLDLTIKGHPFWQYMRYYVFEEINREKSQTVFPKQDKYYARKLKELLNYFLYRLKCLFQRQKRFDLLFFTHNKTALIDGKKVDFHFYPLAKAFHKSLKIMIANRYDFSTRRSDYPCPLLLIRPLFLFNRLKSYFVGYSQEDKKAFVRLSSLINKTFHTHIDIYSMAKYLYSWHLASYREYLRFFKNYRPSALIFCDSGDTKPLAEAAHDLGIKVIDYQHGIISLTSILYSFPKGSDWNKLKATNADYVFTFGDYWRDFFRTPSVPVSVGFPYFDLCRKKTRSPLKNNKGILITSVLSARKILSQLAVDLADLLPDYTIYYKLRADEYDSWKTIYPANFAQKTNIVILDGNNGSLYDYYAKCNYLISTNSMTLYEGLASGLTPFVLKVGWHEEVQDLYERKLAMLVSSADEIAQAIRNEAKPPSSLPTDHLFKENSLSHVESFLCDLLQQKQIDVP